MRQRIKEKPKSTFLAAYVASTLIGYTAGYLYRYPDQFPDDFLSGFIFAPIIQLFQILVIFGVSENLFNVIVLLALMMMFVCGILYLRFKKEMFLILFSIGTIISSFNVIKIFWTMMSV